LLVQVSGRLDASWAEHFSATFREYIRQGHHHLVLEAAGMSYLSSAGIRALVQVTKSVLALKGSLQIFQANSFVEQTLTMTGFESWLIRDLPGDMPPAGDSTAPGEEDAFRTHRLEEAAGLKLSLPATWRPWQGTGKEPGVRLRFGNQDFALGIGAPNQPGEDARRQWGEFLAIGGQLVYQPPREGEHPDFLLAEKDFIPEMQCIQALQCSGGMTHLLRFAPRGYKSHFGMGELAEKVLLETGSDRAALVVLAEIDGLVGASLVRSPGLLEHDRVIPFPEVKEWLSYCGERVHPGQLALVFGLAARQSNGRKSSWLAASSFYQGLHLHLHAAVFPYQPLEAGIIQLQDITKKLFNGPPPMSLLHLVEDDRPVAGLGESSFLRGACWCAAIQNDQEDMPWE